jgi:hypothetical protein
MHIGAMKMKCVLAFVLSTCVALLTGCIGTEDGSSVAGMPFTKDRFISRYERPVPELVNVTRAVLNRNGRILLDNSVNNSFEAKVNQHSVWVKVTAIDPRVTEVAVQARGGMVGDADTAEEISKQIGMGLVSGQ